MIQDIITSTPFDVNEYKGDGVYRVDGDTMNIYMVVVGAVWSLPYAAIKFFEEEIKEESNISESFALKMLAVAQGKVKELEL